MNTEAKAAWFRILDPSEVRADVAEHVLDVADRASAALDLAPMTVVLYEPCAADHPGAWSHPGSPAVRGFHVRSRPGDVHVRAGMSRVQTERTLVHELRHEWQRAHGFEETHTRADLERDAYSYADAWMGARV